MKILTAKQKEGVSEMIICKKCGHTDVYTGAPCSSCGEKFALTEDDVKLKLMELEAAIREKHYEDMLECYHLLADIGQRLDLGGGGGGADHEIISQSGQIPGAQHLNVLTLFAVKSLGKLQCHILGIHHCFFSPFR